MHRKNQVWADYISSINLAVLISAQGPILKYLLSMITMIYARIFHLDFKFKEISFIWNKFQVDWRLFFIQNY